MDWIRPILIVLVWIAVTFGAFVLTAWAFIQLFEWLDIT